MAKLQDGSIYRVVSTINGRLWLEYYKGSLLQTAEKRLAMRANLLKNYMSARLELRFVRGADHSYQVLDAWQQGLQNDYQQSVKNAIASVDKTHRKLNKIGLYAIGLYTVSASERQAMDDQLDWLFAQRQLGLIELCDDERGCISWHGVNCKCWFDTNGQVLKKVQQGVISNETPAPEPEPAPAVEKSMATFVIRYIEKSGRSLRMTIRATSEEKAIKKLYAQYVKDGIKEVKSVTRAIEEN